MPNPGALDYIKVLLDTVNIYNKIYLQYNKQNNNNHYTATRASYYQQQEAYYFTLASRYDLEYRVIVQNYNIQHLGLVRLEPSAGLAQSSDQYGLEINYTKVAELPDMYVALYSEQVINIPGPDTKRVRTKAEQLILRYINFEVRYQAFNVTKVSDNTAIRYLDYIERVGGLQVKVVILVVFYIRILV